MVNTTKKIKIENRYIGMGNRCFVIAEAGSNHNGDLEIGKKLIESAKKCGCDAVKFQAFKTENLVTRNAKKGEYQEGKSTGENQFEMLKALELSREKHQVLVEHAKSIDMPIFYSVFDEESADLVEQLGVDIFKLGSGELTNIPLIKYIAQKGKPLILSTGMGTDREIEAAVGAFREGGKEELVLMNCSTGYPSRFEDANLRRIRYLGDKFKVLCGHSDHTEGILVSIVAVALGAPIIEKHFTLDKKLLGPDHSMSMDPDEMRQLCSVIRYLEKEPVNNDGLIKRLNKAGIEITPKLLDLILGQEEKKISDSELNQRIWARKSLVAARDINKGEVLVEKDLSIKRPEAGILPKDLKRVLGRKSRFFIKTETPITWDMIE